MKAVNYTFGLLLFMAFLISCSNNTNESSTEEIATQPDKKSADNKPVVKAEKASLVYFHFTRRCATCIAISSNSNEVIAAYTGKASFVEYNLDEDEGKEMGKKLNVGEQALLLLYGDNEIDLTEEAFLNANSNPDKFKQILTEKLDEVLL